MTAPSAFAEDDRLQIRELLTQAIRTLDQHGVKGVKGAAWRIAEAMLLLSKYCPKNTPGIDWPTQRGVMLHFEPHADLGRSGP